MSAWQDLVTVAVLGTERRSADTSALPELVRELAPPPGGDAHAQAAQLLDTAALMVAYRRAGRRALPPVAVPDPAPPETAPGVPAAAARRLAAILAGKHPDTLPEWLALASARGLVAPQESLPALLDAAVRQPALASAVRRVLGARGTWLATFRSDWARATARAVAAAPTFDAQVWEGDDAEARKATWLALRATDPAGALALLSDSWVQQGGSDREQFLDLLDQHLGSFDEPLLEQALDDRRKGVRERAATMLSRLPGSAYAQRMTARLQASVRLERKLLRTRLVVTPPESCDPELARDGIAAKPPQGIGERAWWLQQIVAATPLSAWTEITGRQPRAVLELDVENGWNGTLSAAWLEAAQRQRSAEWAEALIPYVEAVRVPPLMRLIPLERRAAVVTAAVKTTSLMANVHLLSDLPSPWPAALAEAVLTWLRNPELLPYDQRSRTVLSLAGHGLDPSLAPRVWEITDNHDAETPWPQQIAAVADLLTFRREMLEELR